MPRRKKVVEEVKVEVQPGVFEVIAKKTVTYAGVDYKEGDKIQVNTSTKELMKSRDII